MQTLGANLLASLNGDVSRFINLKIPLEWYPPIDRELFEYVNAHILEFGVIPGLDTIKQKTGSRLTTKSSEPPEYYASEIKKSYLQALAKKAMLKAQDHLKNKDPEKAFEVFSRALLASTQTLNHQNIVNLTAKETLEAVIQNYKAMGAGSTGGIPTGYDYLDSQGLMSGGDVLSLVGLSGVGKSYLLFNMALAAWKAETPVIVFSMEMQANKVLERLIAMIARVNMTEFQQGRLATKTFKGKIETLSLKGFPDFIVVDGNMATTAEDVGLLTRQFGSHAAYVDGAYLLQSVNNSRSATWERIKYTVEHLKSGVATQLNIPVFATYQFNNEHARKTKRGVEKAIADSGLEDVAGGKAIGDTSSVVIGLFQEITAATLRKKTLSVLKGRDGQTGQFDINWIFNEYPFMDFSQITEPDFMTLQFD